MDQAPGPTIATIAPSVAWIMGNHGSLVCEKYLEPAIHILTTASSAPATGVHKPAKMSSPAPIEMTSGTMISKGGSVSAIEIPK